MNSPSESPKNWGQVHPNVDGYHSDLKVISSTLWLPYDTDRWHQQAETHWKHVDLSALDHDMVSIIPHGVGAVASFSLGRDVIGLRPSQATGKMLRETVVVRQFAWANNSILAGNCAVLGTAETENNFELNTQVEERILHTIPKVHDILEMWQGWQNIRAAQKESSAQNKQMTTVGYISDTEAIIKAFWSNLQHDGAAVFKLSERSLLPPALSAKNLLAGRTQVVYVCWIRRIDYHPSESDDNSTPETISDTKRWLKSNGDLDNPNDSEDHCEAHDNSDMEQCSGLKASEILEHHVVNAMPNVPGLIWPTQKAMKQAEKVLVTVSAMETRRNMGNKKK